LKKRIAILGSTGSIGQQALEVIDQHPDRFELEVLSALKNTELLIKQAIRYKPNAVVIGLEELYAEVFDILNPYDIKVYAGEKSIWQIVEMDTIDMVLIAMVGFAGLMPTIHAIKAKKQIALANKESLVVAGELVTKLVHENNCLLIPVDSEHSAIYQCLMGEDFRNIEKIYLTASGGPFLNRTIEELAGVNYKDALNHPNWDMGNKITIDSASLMNKGLEVIEAKWLFGLESAQIDVVIHPQSIIHSFVQFADGSMKAQLSLPDMRLPIQFALGYPDRFNNNFPRFDFKNYASLTFQVPDIKKFRNLAIAFSVLEKGGNMPCILNAANEIVVEAFLNSKIGFLEMPEVIEKTLNAVDFVQKPTIDDYFNTDAKAREKASQFIKESFV
jgi:1-deoxy-D-xylulose-5-phosphate reductoisomerase